MRFYTQYKIIDRIKVHLVNLVNNLFNVPPISGLIWPYHLLKRSKFKFLHLGFFSFFLNFYRPFSNCFVSALAKSRAAGRLVRTMAGDSRNLLQNWLNSTRRPRICWKILLKTRFYQKSIEMRAKCCICFLVKHWHVFLRISTWRL
jgi:hypothetical protein